MKYGIFGKTEMAAAVVTVADTLSTEDMILADQAFDDAAAIATEAESDYESMSQALAVGQQVEVQAALATETLEHPEVVNAATVALARESMALAVIAMGGTLSPEYAVSTEAMQSAPVQSLEVATEGLKDTAKKIYEGIKMIFKKIALSMKKLAAKLVVALNSVGSKAEAVLKSFSVDKDSIPDTAGFDVKVAAKLIKSRAAMTAMIAAGQDTDGFGVGNIQAISAFTSEAAADLTALFAAAGKDGAATEKSLLVALTAGGFKSFKYQLAAEVAKAGSASGLSKLDLGGKAKKLELSSDQTDELNLPKDTVSGSASFYPTYVKGNSIHGVVFYATELSEDELKSSSDVLASVKYSNASVTAMSDKEIEDAAKALKIMDRAAIVTMLEGLKSASKDLKKFSDSRMKDIDVATKEIDAAAKAGEGVALFNRIAGSEFNKIRMFIAGNHISSVFAMASLAKHQLGFVVANIKTYSAPGK